MKAFIIFIIILFSIGISKTNGQSFNSNNFGNPPGCQWAEQFGGSSVDLARDIVTDQNGFIYITGSFSGLLTIGTNSYTSVGKRDAFIAKINPSDGNFLWSQTFQASSAEHTIEPFAITLDNEDHIYITGYYTGTVDLGIFTLPDMGPSNYFYARLDLNANVEYAAGPGQTSTVKLTGKSIKVDETGNVYMMVSDQFNMMTYSQNSTMYSYNDDGGLRWTYSGIHLFDFEIFDNKIYYSGTIIEEGYIGEIYLDPPDLRDAFLARSDLEGNFEWAKIPSHNEPSGHSEGYGLTIDGNGGIYQCGQFWLSVTFGNTTLSGYKNFIVKADLNGEYSWANSLTSLNAFDLSYGNGSILTTSENWFYLLNSGTGTIIRDDYLDISPDRTTYSDFGIFITTGDFNEHVYVSSINENFYQVWMAETEGDSGHGYCIGTSYDPDGHFYSFNSASNEIDFFGHNVGKGLFLARQSIMGNVDWILNFPGTNQGCGIGRYVLADPAHHAVYITGTFNTLFTIPGVTVLSPGPNGSIYVIKFSDEGEYLWHIQEDFESNYQSVSVDGAENVIISGIFSGTITIGDETLISSGYEDAYIAKYNSEGIFQWAIKGGGEDIEYLALTASDQAGNIYFTGEFTSKNISFGGQTFTMEDGAGNIAVAKITPAGQVEWFKPKGGSVISDYAGWPTTITSDKDGYFYIKGWHADSAYFDNFLLTNPYTTIKYRNLFIASFDPSGNTQWAHTINQSQYGYEYNQMDIDSEGSVYFGAPVRDVVYFEDDFSHVNPNYPNAVDLFIAKYTTTGTLDWVKVMPASNNLAGKNWISSISVINNDEFIMGGYFYNHIDLDPISLSSNNLHGMIAMISSQVNIPDSPSLHGKSLTISPNPSSDIINLEFPDDLNDDVKINISDLSGKVLMKRTWECKNKEMVIDVSNLSPGVYLIQAEGASGTLVQKFIIRRL